MGYTQESNITISIPLDLPERFNAIAAEEGWLDRWYAPEPGASALDVTVSTIIGLLGEDGGVTVMAADASGRDLQTSPGDPEVALDDPRCQRLNLHGWTYGKCSTGNDDAAIGVLAELGATGTIDFEGEEGNKWRARLRDGFATDYDGIITYPGDPGD